MAGLQERLREEAKAIASAPLIAAMLLAVVVAAVWALMQWSYHGALAGKDAYIAALERRVAEYRDKLDGASADEARARIAALETEVKTLRIRLQPRRLTALQRQTIIDRSRPPAGASANAVAVLVQDKCSDCVPFATELVDALRDSGGWSASVRVAGDLRERLRTGLGIRIADPLRPPAAAIVLQQALQWAGVPFEMLGGGTGERVELVVGERLPQ